MDIINDHFLKKHYVKQEILVLVFFLVIFSYRLIMAMQGLNVYDEGFQLVGFQHIIKNPESVQYQFLYYFSFLCGGIWNLLAGDYSIYGLRVFSAIIETSTFLILYKMLKDVVRTRFILIGILLLVLFNGSGIFNHNTLTTFFNILAAYCLYIALCRKKGRFIFISGIILGFNVFVRIPNLAMTGLIFLLIPFYYFNKDKKLLKDFMWLALAGFIVGNIIIILIMLLMNHLPYMIEAVSGQFYGDNDSSHNLSHIIKTYIKLDYIPVIKYVAYLFIIPISIVLFSKKIKYKWMFYIQLCVSMVLFVLIIYYRNNYILLLNAFSTAVLILSLFYFHDNSKIIFLSVLGILIEYFQPLGGDWGFINMGVLNLYLAFTLSCGLMYKILKNLDVNKFVEINLYCVLFIFYCSLSIIALKRTIFHEKWYGTYPVWTLTYKPHLQNVNVLLDVQRGKELEEITEALNKYVKEGDYFLSLDEFPISYYLTGTQPYLFNPLVWCYSSDELQRRISQAENERGIDPVILLEKNTGVYYSYKYHKFDLPDSYKNNNEKNRVYMQFLEKHNYKQVWENHRFAILLPYKN